MRTEREIIDSVLDFAMRNDGVRAVIRTDLLPVRDYLFACNFIFVVNDVDAYDHDVFAECLGDRILLFRADRNYPEMFPNAKAHLMVFRDGATIVITAMDRGAFLDRYSGGQNRDDVWIADTYQKLLDKDDLLPMVERLEEKQTLSAAIPTEEEFAGACDEFWWVLKTFAEYALQEELPPAMYYLNVSVRGLLNRLLRWHIVLQAGGPVDMGILDANMEKLLDEDLFPLYRRTYPDADTAHIWQAYRAVAELWRRVGNDVAERLGFRYPKGVERDMLAFIQNLRELKPAQPKAFPHGEGGGPQG